MSDYLHTDVRLVVRHVPDHSMETGPDGNKVRLELPGHVEIGADVGGVFFPLAKMGKTRFDKHLARAEKSE